MENAKSDIYTEEQLYRDIMHEHDTLMKEIHDEISRSNLRILRAIESVKGSTFRKDLEDLAAEDCCYDKYKLVKEPQGHMQEEDWGEIQQVWVNQTTNGGYSGDEFAGCIYVQIKEGLFLQMHYSM